MQGSVDVALTLGDPLGAAVARQAAREFMRPRAHRVGLADDVCLVISELVTNAMIHGRSDTVVRLRYVGECLRLEVADQNSRLPVLVAPDPESLSGRGLALVAAVSSLWGADRTGEGKVVWAEFDVTERRARPGD